MKRFILVNVPIDSDNYFINNVGCLRYSQNQGKESSVVEPEQIGAYLEKDKHKIMPFKDPKPAREVSLIFQKTALKNHIIDALRNTISGVVKGAIAFQNVQIISPIYKR